MKTPLSYSRLRLFLACPRQYEFRLKKTPQTSLPLIMTKGKYAHRFYEEYAKVCIANDSMQMLGSLDDLKRYVYVKTCGDAAVEGEPFLTPQDWTVVFNSLCKPWAERTALPVEAITAVESRWAVNENGASVPFDGPDVFFRGVFDRVEKHDSHTRVVDYKTGWGGKMDPMQVRVYAWALLMLDMRANVVEVVAEYTATDKKESFTYTRDDFDMLDEDIGALAEVIHSCKEFRPRPGAACAECPYAYCCDAKAQIVNSVITEHSAQTAIEAIALLERDLKAQKDALRGYIQTNGPVTHNGLTWDEWVSEGLGFHDPAAFLSALAAAGVDPAPYVSVNNVRAKKLRKQFPDLVTPNPKPVTRFMAKKATGEEEED